MWCLRKITNQIVPVLMLSKLDIFIDFYTCDSVSVNYPSGYLDCSVCSSLSVLHNRVNGFVKNTSVCVCVIISECLLEHNVGIV